MDFTVLFKTIAEHGGSLGILFTIFGLCVACGTALGQWTAKRVFVAVTEELRNVAIKLDLITSQLTVQQQFHAATAEMQRTHSEDLHLVSNELKAITSAIRDSDQRRGQEMLSVITAMVTRCT